MLLTGFIFFFVLDLLFLGDSKSQPVGHEPVWLNIFRFQTFSFINQSQKSNIYKLIDLSWRAQSDGMFCNWPFFRNLKPKKLFIIQKRILLSITFDRKVKSLNEKYSNNKTAVYSRQWFRSVTGDVAMKFQVIYPYSTTWDNECV